MTILTCVSPDSSDSEAVDGEEGEEVMAALRKKMKELSAAHELVVKNRCVCVCVVCVCVCVCACVVCVCVCGREGGREGGRER